MRIATHLEVQLSPPPAPPSPHTTLSVIDTTDLESEGSESSDSKSEDDSGSKEGSPTSWDKPDANADTSSANNLDAADSKSDWAAFTLSSFTFLFLVLDLMF